MDSLALIALLLTLLYLILTISKNRRRDSQKNNKNPPEPSNAWPIIGHLRVLAGPEVPHRALGALADRYGPIFALRIGLHHRVLVVSSADIVKDLFTVNDTAVMSRPALTVARLMSYNFAISGAGPHGAYWRQMRKIQSVELFSSSRLKLHRHMRESEVEKSMKDLHRKVAAAGEGKGLEVELKRWVGDLTLSLMIRMIVGESCSGVDHPRLMAALTEFFHCLGMFVMRDAVPFLGWMDIGGHEREMKRIMKKLDEYLQGWLIQHKQKNKLASDGMKNPPKKTEQGFMDVLLSVLDEESLHGYDRDTIIKATSLSMIAGGTDTSTATTTWAIALLLNHRHVLRKAQEELDRCVSRERAVTEEDLVKLVYLQAIVKEAMRMCPVAPLLVAREFTTDCVVAGYRVQKGTWLMVNAWKIYTDPNLWPDPMEFKPERFLTTHQHVEVKGQNFELIPFGSGRRICPGMNLALQMVTLMLASFLHAFEISTPGDKPVGLKESFGFSNILDVPLDVVVTPRLSPNVYAG